jgi:hypothetical protein
MSGTDLAGWEGNFPPTNNDKERIMSKKICRLCGWEVKMDFGSWVDVYDSTACGKNGQLTHQPS